MPGDTLTVKFEELDPAARSALVSGALDSSLLNDSFAEGMHDPIVAGAVIRDVKPGQCSLQVKNESNGVYMFEIMVAGRPEWSAWLRNATITAK